MMKKISVLLMLCVMSACSATTQVKEIKAREDNLPKPKLILDKKLGDKTVINETLLTDDKDILITSNSRPMPRIISGSNTNEPPSRYVPESEYYKGN